MKPANHHSSTVTIRGVSKWYPGSSEPVHAVDDINLELSAGEFVSLLGPSGCGKSTLMLMVAGLIPTTRGSIEINGSIVSQPRTDLGIVFQAPVLLDWLSAEGNVMLQARMRGLDPEQSRHRARDLLLSVGLGGFEDSLPYQLSGGMMARVAICRALLHNPPLLLMDEPFGALDALTRDQLNRDILEIWSNDRPSVLFVTHSITEALYLSDRVVVMSERPGNVASVINVNLPRPRQLEIRESQEFVDYARHIRELFGKLGVLREVPGAANKFSIQTQPSATATAGVPFAQQPVLQILDKFGNFRSDDSSTVVTASRGAGSGTLQGPTAVTAASGIATFSNLSHNTATNITIQFSTAGASNAISSSVAVSAAAATRLAFEEHHVRRSRSCRRTCRSPGR